MTNARIYAILFFMDDEKEKLTVSDNTPMPIPSSETVALDSSDELAEENISRALEPTYDGTPGESVHEYESDYAEDDSMHGGYASVKGKNVNDSKMLWIVIAVMSAMCIIVGICTSLLTAHFMRSGSKPAVISTEGDIQQNIAAVVTARKPCIVEVQCGTQAASGIVMNFESGKITVMTNAHAIEDYVLYGYEVSVRFYGEDRYYGATVVGYNEHYDVAVLTVNHTTTYTVQILDDPEFFSPDTVYNEGDYVVSIGNAMGLGVASYEGIISRKSELYSTKKLFVKDEDEVKVKTVPVFRTTAVINAGMSGGGVFDMHGRLIGLGTYRMSNMRGDNGAPSEDVENTGFATPVSVLYPVYRRILEVGSGGAVFVTSVNTASVASSAIGWLGLPFGFNCEYRNGALTVISPDLNSPAAGVEVNDVVVKIGERNVTDDICATVGAFISYNTRGTGQTLVLTLKRNDTMLSFSAPAYRYAL